MYVTKKEIYINQTKKKFVLKLRRKDGSNGRIVVPWSVKSENENSPYQVRVVVDLFEIKNYVFILSKVYFKIYI